MKKNLLLLNLFLASGLYAQLLTMQESIEKTLQHHPDIKSFMLKFEQSRRGYDVSFADYLPQVDIYAQYNPMQTFVLPQNGSLHTIDDDGWSAGISLKQKVWDFSRTSSKVKASKLDEDISRLSLEDAKVLMAYRVKSLYKLMVVHKEAISVREKDLESKQAYYEQAKALVRQGLKTEADASRFLSAVYGAQNAMAIARSLYAKAKISLSLYMGEEIDDEVELENALIRQDYAVSVATESEVLEGNYQLQITLENIKKNRLLHRSAKASRYGSIDMQAAYNYFDTLARYDTKLVGITLNVPLYSGGRINAEAEKARVGMQMAQEAKASRLLSLREEISGLLIDIKRYDKTIAAQKAQIDAANKTKKVLEARYKEGLTTYIEVLDAITLVLNAKLGLLEAYYAKSMVINRLEYLKGKI